MLHGQGNQIYEYGNSACSGMFCGSMNLDSYNIGFQNAERWIVSWWFFSHVPPSGLVKHKGNIHIHGSTLSRVSAVTWIWIHTIYIYIGQHVSMVLQFHESGFIQYTYMWVNMVPCFCGSMNPEPWNYRTTELRIYGFVSMNPRFCGSMNPEPWNHGTTELWNYKWKHGTMEPWIHIFVVPWIQNCRIMETWNYRTMEPQIYGPVFP